MKQKVPNHIKAAWIIMIYACLGIFIGAGITMFGVVSLPFFRDRPGKQHSELIFIGLFFTLLFGVELYVGYAIRQHKNWGRVMGILLGSISLLAFPIGTIVGTSILWLLIKDWRTEQLLAQPSAQPDAGTGRKLTP